MTKFTEWVKRNSILSILLFLVLLFITAGMIIFVIFILLIAARTKKDKKTKVTGDTPGEEVKVVPPQEIVYTDDGPEGGKLVEKKEKKEKGTLLLEKPETITKTIYKKENIKKKRKTIE